MESNEVLERLPRHLMNLVIDQPYNAYSPQDHAVWRYVMRQNVKHLPEVAHSSYLHGLQRTGISIEHIPHMYGMNRILLEIGWAAVAVDGFIPPAAFMEFQAHNVLVIASDIRPVDQIHYTPAPDIIHEAAGHAPIIADQEYASYLQAFGKLGSLAFSSDYDQKIYDAIRHLSILKADPYTRPAKIRQAEKELDLLNRKSSEPSEMALLRNLHWWTVEYGLIGDLKKPKIYGAGLLSSIGESNNCLKDRVRKLPYSIEAQHVSFDITRQQPQLFVTADFEQLNRVLAQFAATMAVQHGGIKGLVKALNSGNISTIQYSSGLQVSGILSGYREFDGEPSYVIFKGPSLLAVKGAKLPGHGPAYHSSGFGSPAGRLNGIHTPLEFLSSDELDSLSIKEGDYAQLQFESGVTVKGTLRNITRNDGINVLFSFTDCTVSLDGETLFRPEWGVYDMAAGEALSSVFSGAADPDAFGFTYPLPAEKTHKLNHSSRVAQLHSLYDEIRNMRTKGGSSTDPGPVFAALRNNYPEEWLLPLEILELPEAGNRHSSLASEIREYLKRKATDDPDHQQLITDGLELLD